VGARVSRPHLAALAKCDARDHETTNRVQPTPLRRESSHSWDRTFNLISWLRRIYSGRSAGGWCMVHTDWLLRAWGDIR
jgi:hypothetical protein